MTNFKQKLIEIKASSAVIEWVGDRDLTTAWAECERGDWMLWFAAKAKVDLKKLTLAKVKCARLVQHLMEDQRSINALDVAEKFANGEATKEELDAAAYAAYAAAAVATYATDSDSDSAYAAADAAYAAAYAARDDADSAADAAAYAAYAAADARKKTLLDVANIVRSIITVEDLKRV